MKQHLRTLLLAVSAMSLTSCLSLETELDLRREDALVLTMRYTVDRALWELGVFDEESQERAVPVSRRDAEETALRYSDVTLEEYRLEDKGEEVTVSVRYRAETVESLRALWGTAAGTPIAFQAGYRGVSIPLATGPESVDPEQRAFIHDLFRDRHLRITVITPGPIEHVALTAPESDRQEQREGNRYSLTVPLAELLTFTGTSEIVLDW